MATLDHLVLATQNLAQGSTWLEDHLGVTLSAGGSHAAMGTHNRLLKLGSALYLELIAIDPLACAPSRPRWFALDTPQLQARIAERPCRSWGLRVDGDQFEIQRRAELEQAVVGAHR